MSPAPEDERNSREKSALSPDELDIEEDENVVSLDEGRYVIGANERPNVPSEAAGSGDGSSAGTGPGAGQAGEEPPQQPNPLDAEEATGAPSTGRPAADSASVKQWLENDLQGTSAQYGFHVTAKAEESISHQQMFSDDVTTVFDSLMRWYAQQLTTSTAVEDVLGILLTESNVRVRYSPSCLQAILESYDLEPDDSIADLFEAVQDGHGMVFPPEDV
ncbi:DUF7500 family protein [Halorussus halophilus]|uniref:DUF7500 family protein n=1 Tax=Halorussus halophilus TaxID=2650975 RepID=UPI00130151AD|nr:hypothetical protein [Halorussus halophilus]